LQRPRGIDALRETVKTQEDLLKQVSGHIRITGNRKRGSIDEVAVAVIHIAQSVEFPSLQLEDQIPVEFIFHEVFYHHPE
jgi:hypothetical protein